MPLTVNTIETLRDRGVTAITTTLTHRGIVRVVETVIDPPEALGKAPELRRRTTKEAEELLERLVDRFPANVAAQLTIDLERDRVLVQYEPNLSDDDHVVETITVESEADLIPSDEARSALAEVDIPRVDGVIDEGGALTLEDAGAEVEPLLSEASDLASVLKDAATREAEQALAAEGLAPFRTEPRRIELDLGVDDEGTIEIWARAEVEVELKQHERWKLNPECVVQEELKLEEVLKEELLHSMRQL